MRRLRFFLASEMGAECEACGARVDLISGGLCIQCGRVLCARHLHGSRFRQLLVDLGASPRCVRCRAAAGRRASVHAGEGEGVSGEGRSRIADDPETR